MPLPPLPTPGAYDQYIDVLSEYDAQPITLAFNPVDVSQTTVSSSNAHRLGDPGSSAFHSETLAGQSKIRSKACPTCENLDSDVRQNSGPIPATPPSGSQSIVQPHTLGQSVAKSNRVHTATIDAFRPPPSTRASSPLSGFKEKTETNARSTNPANNDRERNLNTVRKLWLLELLAAIFSFVCMGAIFGVLAYADGKPLDQWRFQITPNTVVSFIAAIAKTSSLMVVAETIGQLKWLHFRNDFQRLSDLQLFDDASRGPLGSVRLLTTKYKDALLASCAASVILLSLFIDPFVQLVLQHPSRSILDPTKLATFQTTVMYDPNEYEFDGRFTTSSATAVDTTMRAAIMNGIYNKTTPPSAVCSTGNCTWGPLTTLGVCGGCDEITNEVKINCAIPRSSPVDLSDCDYFFPNSNVSLQAHSWMLGASGVFQTTRWNSTAGQPKLNNKPNPQGGNLMLLVTIQAIQVAIANSSDSVPPAKAYSCGLMLCVKSYSNLTVQNGKPEFLSLQDDYLYDKTDPRQENGETIQQMVRNTTLHGGKDSTVYRINQADVLNIRNYLVQMFTTGWYDDGFSTRMSGFGDDEPIAAPDVGRELAGSVDLNQTISQLADSMTEVIRTSRNSIGSPGKAYVQKVTIRISWPWLAYPVVLLILTVVLLGTIIFLSRKSGMNVWKNSSLALLMHQIQGMEAQQHEVRDPQKLKALANSIKIRASDDLHAPVFIKQD